MPSTGYIQIRAFTSRAQLPLKDVAITVTSEDGTVIAMRLTNRSGLIDAIELPVPERSESQQPNPDETPYAIVNIYANKRGYEQIVSDNLQVFSGVTTILDLEMIPLAELPDSFNQTETFQTPPQDL